MFASSEWNARDRVVAMNGHHDGEPITNSDDRGRSSSSSRWGNYTRTERKKNHIWININHSMLSYIVLLLCFISATKHICLTQAALMPNECERGEYKYSGFCYKCPPGRYGSTTTNIGPACTGNCPKGRYRSTPGGKTVDDCEFCPAGKFGFLETETRSDCSGTCPAGKYSKLVGATDNTVCIDCPLGYYDYQCNYSKRNNPSNAVPSDFLNNRPSF